MHSQTSGYQLSDHAAELYERYSVPMTTGPLAELMFKHVLLHRGEWVLDVACGTGIVARLAAERVGATGEVIGVDLNPSMLAVARANTPTTGAPIEWRQGDARDLPFPDKHFDVVLCQQGLQYVPDKLAALRDMRRVLLPSGRIAFTVWSETSPYNAAMADALARHVSDDAARRCLSPSAWRDANVIRHTVGEAGFRAIDMQELALTVRRLSSVEAVLADMARSQFARDIEMITESERLAIAQEVSAALQVYGNGDDCVYSQKCYLVQAWATGCWARLWWYTKAAWIMGLPAVPPSCSG